MTVPQDSSDSTQSDGVKDAAQAHAQNVASTTLSEATDVAQTAKEQVANVTSDVRAQTRQLADEARGQLTDHASSQRDRAVESLRSVANDFSSMADNTDGSGLGVQLAREGGDITHKAADFLEQRDPSQLLDELRQLARRRPGAFLVGAALAGVVVGRLARGAKSAHSNDGRSSEDSTYQRTYPSTYGQTHEAPAEYGAPVTGQPAVAGQGATTETGVGTDYGVGEPVAPGMPTYPNTPTGDAW